MRLRVLVASLSIVALGCGGAVPQRPSDDRVHEAWVEPIFGRAADFAVVVRMRAVRDDPSYAKLSTKRRQIDSDLDDATWRAIFDCDEISFEAIVLDWKKPWRSIEWIAVARGEPSDLSPDALRSGSRPMFRFVQRTPAGVSIYAFPSDNKEALFVFPGGTWVVATNGLFERIAKSSSPPPPLRFDPDVTSAAYMSGAMMRASSESAYEEKGKATVEGIDFAVAEMDAPAGDDAFVSDVKLAYLDEASAKNAERALDEVMREALDALKRDDSAVAGYLLAALKIGREGRVVRVDLRVPRFLAEKAVK